MYWIASDYADSVAASSPGAAMYGSKQLYVGLLAEAMGDHDLALTHRRAAVGANARISTPPYLRLLSTNSPQFSGRASSRRDSTES